MAPHRTAEELRGFEYDWLAVDADGSVALFSTAGGGDAPPALLADPEGQDAAIASLLRLARLTVPSFAPTLADHLVNTWLLAAERGVFAYDASPTGGPYRLVAAPKVATNVENLPPEVAAVASRTTFSGVRFGVVREVGLDLLSGP